MAAASLNEVFNFVNKFMNLRKNGENATLSLQCQDGSVSVNLHLHLPSYPPPRYEPHPPPGPSPRSRLSPSRIRRSLRRAVARAHAEKADKEQTSKAHTQQSPAEQAATEETSANQDDDAEEALRNDTIGDNLTDTTGGNDAEEAFDKIDEKNEFQQSEAETAEQADFPADDKFTKSIQNKSAGTPSHQQPKNLLVCNYCNEGFANEVLLRDHTEIVHRSGRIRYRIT